MRVVGIIAEYNPFHRGHEYQLREAKRRSQADAAVIVMSSVFTQRGDPAIFSAHDRARMALLCGADAVIALPAMYAVRDAEHFALSGISLLKDLGVDAVSFGCETDDLPLLRRTAMLLEQPDKRFESLIRAHLSAGRSHPEALSAAVRTLDPAAADILCSPNNTLAVCYLRAMLRLDAGFEAAPVARSGGYHDTAASADALPSATAVRQAILQGDWQTAWRGMPAEAAAIARSATLAGHIHRPESLDPLWTQILRSAETLKSLPTLSEGIEDRLYNAALEHYGRQEILSAAKARRYPYARLSRMAAHALLGITGQMMLDAPLPPAALLLGFRRDAPGLLNRLSSGSIPLLTHGRELAGSDSWLQAERRAWDLWSLGVGGKAGTLFSDGMVTL